VPERTIIDIIYTEKHCLRNAKTELHGGELVAPFEAPLRAQWILKAVTEAEHGPVIKPAAYSMETALKVHDAGYLAFLETAWDRWAATGMKGEAIPVIYPVRRMQQHRVPRDIEGALGYYALGAETSLTDGTFAAALASMNCSLTGTDRVADYGAPVFALCRPPGHHASFDQFGGYCFINNAAVAAQRFLDHGAKKVAVLDVDFHHGNGTQDIFYQRGDVFVASLHGDPLDAFPHFLGFADERGEGEGEGANANYPLPPGTQYYQWAKTLDAALGAIGKFGAEALVVSLGVDTFEKDPISFFKLNTDDFKRYGEVIGRLRLPTLFLMEGGYGVEEIGTNVANVLSGFEAA
jgi:acetoin utilization deacetylase AcuC-like enzyme